MNIQEIFSALNLTDNDISGGTLDVFAPRDGAKIASVTMDTAAGVDAKIAKSTEAFKAWRMVPGPRRGELVRLLGEILRDKKEALGSLVSLECGKIYQEGLGEVQEMIDICDFAVGLSRQLYGLTIASERPLHKMREYWQPIGPVGIISAFNFPVAVWAWNSALALVCGDSVIWKPSEKTPLTGIACHKLLQDAIARFGEDAPDGLSQLLIGERDIGEIMVDDKRVPVISATGSCAMGRIVGPKVAARFGRSILELGGNNALIVAPSADLDLAFQGILFGAVGTCGQRCTSTRRVFVHDSVYDQIVPRLKKAYEGLSIGDPLDPKTLVGPLIDQQSYENMEAALKLAASRGGEIVGGGRALADQYPNAYYVNPAIVEMTGADDNVQEETFAPILYIFKYSDLTDAIARQNDVPQGLSSAIFTRDVLEAETFTCEAGSDCGIANVNIGTSGAEIGGAFGGEKETGGGRESGSDSWKAYMRRMTSTLNYSTELPLAQGIKFGSDD
ncbi:aldehyde dehydrogenase family protein [Paremcibacter congregatus]|uniref:aldehyde dehydrogenase (NAD(+)) n=1 Tax=Paremcibacter congregatus TaxID=2043170 RepID=A0A2G4YQP8_9PROT|nr:aldehyde dehydrogenase family protein [Paremcibacter congregatus]QDE29323.1 aldehyde dehydrogenase family protein [Paremcibacter congregatus]